LKKSVVMVLVALICISAVFAADNSVKVSAVPYALQISTTSEKGVDSVNSRYGFGLEAAYQRKLTGGLFAEAGVAWHTFLMPDSKPAFTNILAFAGVGYKFEFAKKFACSVSADVGTDTLIYNSKVSENITLLAGFDASYAINDSIEILLGCRSSFGFAKKDSTKFVNYRIIPVLGVNFEF